MKTNEKIDAFVARLVWLKASQEMVAKYVAIFKNLLHYRKNQEAQVSLHAPHIKMAELRDARGERILSTEHLLHWILRGDKVSMVFYPELDLQYNLVTRIKKGALKTKNAPKSYRPIGHISVWQEPNEDGSPRLTLEQIIAQIPRGLVGDTKAVCLLNDGGLDEAYNSYMDCHEYEVWLFGWDTL